MACIPRHLLPTHPMTYVNFSHVDVILTRSQISICSMKCIRLEWSLPGTTVYILFLNSVDLLLYFLFQDYPQFDKSWILIWSFDQRESIWTVQSSCLRSYDQSTLKPASNLYAFKIMFSLGPYGKSYVCIWEYFVFCLCLRYFKCSPQTHNWENKQYGCRLWQGTYSHIKSIF